MGDEYNLINQIKRKLADKEALSTKEQEFIDYMRKLKEDKTLTPEKRTEIFKKGLADREQQFIEENKKFLDPRKAAIEKSKERMLERNKQMIEGRAQLLHGDVPRKDIVTEQMKKAAEIKGTLGKSDMSAPIISGEEHVQKLADRNVAKAVAQEVATGAKPVEKAIDYGQMLKEYKLAQKAKSGLKAAAKTGLKAIPILGSIAGIGSALSSGNVSAAVPLAEASDLGAPRDSLEGRLEAGEQLSPEEYEELKSGRFQQLKDTLKE